MNCKNCGTPLMGMEHACPVCGAPLPTQQPTQGGVPVIDPAMAAMPQQMASQPPQMMPGGTPPMGTPLEDPQPEPKKGNNIFGILLLLVAFAAIGVGIFLALTDEEEEPKKETTPQEETTPSEPTVNYTDYAGYSFIVPTGYSAEISETYGLIIRGTDKIYTISVDYSNTYEYYKQEFTKYFPDKTTTTNINETKEFTMSKIGEAGSAAMEYMTKAEETSTFAGLVVKSDYSEVTTDDVSGIYDILNSANIVTDINPGDQQDAGRVEIVNYMNKFNKDDFVF